MVLGIITKSKRGECGQKVGLSWKELKMSYSKEQQAKALELYHQCKLVSKTVCILVILQESDCILGLKMKIFLKNLEKNFH